MIGCCYVSPTLLRSLSIPGCDGQQLKWWNPVLQTHLKTHSGEKPSKGDIRKWRKWDKKFFDNNRMRWSAVEVEVVHHCRSRARQSALLWAAHCTTLPHFCGQHTTLLYHTFVGSTLHYFTTLLEYTLLNTHPEYFATVLDTSVLWGPQHNLTIV